MSTGNKLLFEYYSLSYLGGPVLLGSSDLGSSISAAISLANQEQIRQPAFFSGGAIGIGIPDPDIGSHSIPPSSQGATHPDSTATTEMMEIYRLLPALNEVPDDMLKNLPHSFVFGLHSALSKDSKSASKLSATARLSLNAKKIAANPTKLGNIEDDRKNKLHPGRFLGGAVCKLTDLWLAGKTVHGEKGPLALGSYDLDSVGCGGCVTAKGWEALHNPGSQELKLKMFHLPNVGNSSYSAKRLNFESGEELSLGESLKEIVDMESYRTALNTAREAFHSAQPWNRSMSAIIGFMINSNYCYEDLKGNPKRASILSEFTDYVFGRNALNWENNAPFLTSEQLAHVWSQWRGKRAVLFSGVGLDRQKTKTKTPSNICRRYQVGLCPKQADKECKSPSGAVLKHVCNKFMAGGKLCEKDHPRKDHK